MNVQFQAENLRKEFNGRPVIDAVSFSLREGRTLCVTGANGSGKSTLFRICAGLLRPDTGGVLLFVDGERTPITGKSGCALVSPGLRWYTALTARENITFFRAQNRTERYEHFCERFGLAPHLDTRLEQYSSGMVQRFALAMAFGSDAPLLLFDEPGSFLDGEGKNLFCEIFKEESSSRIALIATNDKHEAQLCEKEVRLG
jgi:ABC-2 type transport system ATP-binding protein